MIVRHLSILGAAVFCLLGLVKTALAADIGYLSLCSANLPDISDKSIGDVAVSMPSVNSWDDLVDYVYEEYLSHEQEEKHKKGTQNVRDND